METVVIEIHPGGPVQISSKGKRSRREHRSRSRGHSRGRSPGKSRDRSRGKSRGISLGWSRDRSRGKSQGREDLVTDHIETPESTKMRKQQRIK